MEITNAQKINKKLLYEFDKYCEKHSIKYRLEAGTLIGAIRDKGFIPWDDDIDVAMKREEYDKLIKCLNEDKMGDDFLLMTPEKLCEETGHFHDFTTRIFYIKEIYRDEEKYKNKFNGIFRYLWLDIFILDEVNEINVSKKKFLYGLALKYRYSINFKNKNIIEKIAIKFLCFLGNFISLKKIINLYLKKEKVDEAKFYYYVNYPIIYINYKTPKKYEEEYIKVPFEDIYLYVPKYYEEVLNILYPNYKNIPDIKDQIPSHIDLDI